MGRTACTDPQCLYKGALYLYHYEVKRKAVYGEHIRPTVCDPILRSKRFVIFY
jgi:hypothetical protein